MKRIALLFALSLFSSQTLAETTPDFVNLPTSQLSDYLDTFKHQQQSVWFDYRGQRYPLQLVDISEGALFVRFEQGLLWIDFDFETGPGASVLMLQNAPLDQDPRQLFGRSEDIWVSSQVRVTEQGDNFLYQGQMRLNGSPSEPFQLSMNESLVSAGTSEFTVQGNQALLAGELGTNTYLQLSKLVKQQPQVDTIVIQSVYGSLNDEINMHTGRLLRQSGLNTVIPRDGFAYSGGVDLFVAGVKRNVEPGAKVGVHSWCCIEGVTAADLPRNDPAHHDQLVYFNQMLAEKGREFYYYTLHAAPYDGIHEMSDDEINEFSLITK
ncbi:hypothetical protein [Vibrio sinaloensis]|uniref:hypothetical protein n=1 Tax=Photobacterium sp. (strain ATCC 43367) TaxID=379097 RepID=UPI002065B4BC|nr:hypothetical protein [Vibrio sinaloensis]UPQ90142.1 hypothetical protein MTO69_15400 [Vibrio sinaloensis]